MGVNIRLLDVRYHMVPMAKDNQIAVRFNDPTYEAIQEFAENKDFSQAEAVRKCTESRLAGEGYLDGPAVADGGEVVEKIEDVDEKLDTMNSAVSSDIQDYRADLKMFYVVLAFSLLWIGVAQIATVPWWVVVGTGSIVLVSVIYSFLVITGWFDE